MDSDVDNAESKSGAGRPPAHGGAAPPPRSSRPDYPLEALAPFWPDLSRGQRMSIFEIAEACAAINRSG